MNTPNQSFTDQDIFSDILTSQRQATSGYNTSANECASPALMSQFMNILNEEHQIQHEIFTEMQKRGWYPTEQADQNKVTQAKQKYQGQKP